MAKTTEREQALAANEGDPRVMDSEAPASADDVKTAKPRTNSRYWVNQWNGIDRFQCRNCPYDTLDHADMERHLQVAHSEPARAAKDVKFPQFDRYGAVIREDEQGG